MRKYILFIILLLSTLIAGAQDKKKEKPKAPTPVSQLLRDAHAAIKNKKDQARHEKTLLEALKREDLSNSDKSEIHYTLSLLNISLNDAENMKAYLKQSYDTAAYFNTLLKASRYALLCDSTDTLPNTKGRIKPMFRNKNRSLLLSHRKNLYAGGRFYLRKNDFKSAVPFFATYIDMINEPMLKNDPSLKGDTLLNRSSFYATVASYNSQQPATTLKYIDQALAGCERSLRQNLQEYKVRCLQAVGDSAKWLTALYDGCEDYPTHNYFFTHLVEHFEHKGQYDYGIELADTMLSRVQDIALYWYAKSLMYLHKQDWAKCIEMSDSVLRRDPEHVDALRNKGVCLLNQQMEYAEFACYDMTNPKCRNDRVVLQTYFQQARVPFEKLRKLLPDKKDIWAPPLYRIYLNLNMGKEFAEIEQLLKQT